MTTSTDFESQLDNNPVDWTLRSIYADWLEDQGNPRAESMRWMVANRKRPFDRSGPSSFHAWYMHFELNRPWNIGRVKEHLSENGLEYPTRLAAEIDLHNALVKAGEITCVLIEEVEA